MEKVLLTEQICIAPRAYGLLKEKRACNKAPGKFKSKPNEALLCKILETLR